MWVESTLATLEHSPVSALCLRTLRVPENVWQDRVNVLAGQCQTTGSERLTNGIQPSTDKEKG